MTKIELEVPKEIHECTQALQSAGYEAYIVGGCVRDLLLNRIPEDWDITTNATPEEIQKIFEHTFYENQYGTVGVVNDQIALEIEELKQKDVSYETIQALEKLKVVEITPYRREGKYSDSRRPDEVSFATTLDEDLERRDFSINALAYNPASGKLIDLYGGVQDLQAKIIRTVGDPQDRFNEDALRLLRAVRFATTLGFSVSHETSQAVEKFHMKLHNVSWERIRDEFTKILMSDSPRDGIELLREHKLLDVICPELLDAVGIEQNGSHIYDVYEHLLRTLEHAADKKWDLDIRLAALFHDISKPETRRWSKEKNDYTFYGHEVVGAKKTKRILERFRYPSELVSRVTLLVRWHMFFSDPDEISLSAVRRIIRNVGGGERVWDLIKLRICDRIGMGRPKEQPYRLRQYEAMMEEAMRSPVSVQDLKISGDDIMELFHMKPGKRIGWLLHACMRETLHMPENNNYDWLVKHVTQLNKLSDEELERLHWEGKEAIDTAEEAELAQIRKKYKVGRR
ncbi:MAG: CCA tRNA nucleotidyltransferase [Patescibacteria group bacterium]